MQSAVERRLARGVLAQTGLQDAAHDALINLRGFDASATHRFAHHKRPQPRGRKGLKRALKPAHWDAHR